MVNKGKEFNNMFKENRQSGEHRNGRKSQYKNNNKQQGEAPNEYLSQKED
ncbi:hypothetical protein ACDX78_03820 [Virgibacillus oceani]